MKTTTSRLAMMVIAVSLFFAACKKNDSTLPSNPENLNPTSQRIKEQLDSVVKIWNTNAIVDLKLKGYKLEETNITNSNLTEVKQQLLNGNNIVPYFDGKNASSFRLNTLQQSIALQKSAQPTGLEKLDQDAGDRFSRTINNVIQPGQHVATLQWQVNGQTITSTCVYDSKGLVYDNVLTNMFVVTDNTQPSESKLNKLSSQNVIAASQQAYTATVVDLTIKWVWGSERGKVRVYHSILVDWSKYKILSNWGSSNNYMSVGSADSRQSDYGNHGTYALLSWAYGWATPTADFSFSHDGNFKWSVSLSGVGSKGGGQGIHNYYLN